MTVNNIFEFLNRLFPTDTACDFDNVGLLVGDGEAEVKKALISLDCTFDTLNEAIKNGCELIITHHPVIFTPLKSVTEESIIFNLIKNNIAVISMHTNMDIGANGVNDCLCQNIGLKDIKSLIAEDGYLLKSGEIEPQSASDFAKHLKSVLGGRIKFCDGGKPIKNVLVCSGSGGDFLLDAKLHKFDALVTADIKHNKFLEAKDIGISLFDAGHFETEDIIVEPLKETLANEFNSIDFITYHPEIIYYA
ncbi:MAG: Nif3-like dinuclear metal center hexameric protein [Clostridia bacterium]|nr:Nif3-like dinuclear metal center hexameric protein [Clostridia bacterium]